MCFFFFFKQKTAYEIYQCDWSSDVCSSDLKDKCTWCGKCEEICTYGAIEKINSDGKEIAKVIDAGCKGCGACLPVCPEDAIELLGYTNSEIESMIDAIAEDIEFKEKHEVEEKYTEATEKDDDWLIKVEKLGTDSKKILSSLKTESKSIPEISKEANIPSQVVTYLLMSLRKYGYIKDTNDINEDEYYTYALNHESL